jgi:carotenoid cleavage dioxygenase
MALPPRTSPYLDGNFAPVTDEVDVVDLAVTGTIPHHLDGRYLRNGPNPARAVEPATYHWFTGDGMVHGLRLRDGKAEWYRNRWVRSAGVAEALGEPPRPTLEFDFAANTNVIGHAGRTFAIVEGGSSPYELTDELDTVGPCDFAGTLPQGYTAHPKRDPESGELHALSYYFGWGNNVQYTVIGNDARVRRTVEIPVYGSPMMHDFSLTERHVVVYDLPVAFDLDMVTAGATFPYCWQADYPARLGVLPRDADASAIRWFDIEPCYVFHPMNAYDDGDRIVLDVVRYDRMFDRERLAPSEAAPALERWTMDSRGGSVATERRDDRAQEFPRVDERLVGRRHRYGYASSFDLEHAREAEGTVYRHDLQTATSVVRTFGKGCGAGEFVFVPNAADATEDDGVLMGLVYDLASDRSSLFLLDAATLETQAQVHLPVRVPYGFHGNWVPTPV